MDWLINIFTTESYIQAILVISIICAIGLSLGKFKIFGVSLGITFVFFAGIIAGHFAHLYEIRFNREMIELAQNFGLIIFIYSLGVQVGPGFFASFKKGGIRLNILGTSVLIIGTLFMVLAFWSSSMSISETMGLFSGAVTNTPMLGAAQQSLLQASPDDIEGVSELAMACAVGYPMGLIGVIICVAIMKKLYGENSIKRDMPDPQLNTYITEYIVSNPEISGKNISQIMQNTQKKFIISRVWKNGAVSTPCSETILNNGDHLLVISSKNDVEHIRTLFGQKENIDWNKQDIDWNAIDRQLVSKHILITKPQLNGVKLGSLKLRNSLGINITRVNRTGIDLLASPSLRLQLGDKLTIVGEIRAVESAAEILGNQPKDLKNPNLFTIFVGISLGLLLGSIPLNLPGMSFPIKLGIAGGPIIVGLLMGAFGPRLHLSIYTTRSANLMLRELGITIYLACLGLVAGGDFFETAFSLSGLKWLGISFLLATIPVLIVGFLCAKVIKLPYGETVGMLCGSMTNPIALNYATSTVEDDSPAVAYATVYPACMFFRVIIAQIIMLIFI